ncbi:MAG TPA: D-glycerate dehydrogenase [Anaerolineales bacterium]|nr:D-glycerate dehydrogenase [Anaerolineales bacterium]
MKVFVTRLIAEKALSMLRPHVEMEVWPEDRPIPREALLQKVKGLDGLLCLLTEKIDGELMDAAGPSLQVISQMAVGYDNIDVAAVTARRIPVGNTPDVLTDATADMTFALLMAAARRLVEGDKFVRAGQWKTWSPNLLLSTEVTGATLGLVGFGRIGQAVAKRARGFNMRILYHTRTRRPELEPELGVEFADFETLLHESDFVSIHTALNADTRHLFGETQFKQMKRTAFLINTARGPIVDQPALYRALKDGLIAGAALDVTDPEPIPPDDPLLALDNVIIVPHIGSATVQTREKMAVMAAENLLAGLRGERLPNCVNGEVYR